MMRFLLLFAAVAFPFAQHQMFPSSTDRGVFSVLVLSVVLVLYGASAFRGVFGVAHRPLELGIAGLVLWKLCAVVWTNLPVQACSELLCWSLMGVGAIVLIRMLRPNDIEKLPLLATVLVLACSVAGIAQWLHCELPFVAATPPDDRVRAFFSHRNFLATFLAGLLPLVALGLKRRWRYLALLALIIGFFTLCATLTRGGIIGGAIALLVYFWFVKQRTQSNPGLNKKRIVALVFASIFCLCAIATAILARMPLSERDRLLSISSPSVHERLMFYRDALAMWREAPVLGHGLGSFMGIFPRFQSPDLFRLYPATVSSLHSEFLETLVEEGALGVCLGLFFLLFLLRSAYVHCRVLLREDSLYTAAALASLLSLLIHNLVGISMRFAEGRAIAVLAVVVIGVSLKKSDDETLPALKAAGRRWPTGMLVGIVAVGFGIFAACVGLRVYGGHLEVLRGNQLAELGKIDIAREHWQRALQRNPFDQEALLALSKWSSADSAHNHLENLRRQLPWQPTLVLSEAQRAAVLKNTRQAFDYAALAYEINPYEPLGFPRGLHGTLREAGAMNPSLLHAFLPSLMRRFPNNAFVSWLRFQLAIRISDKAAATAALVSLSGLAPGHRDFTAEAVLWLVAEGDILAALTYLGDCDRFRLDPSLYAHLQGLVLDGLAAQTQGAPPSAPPTHTPSP